MSSERRKALTEEQVTARQVALDQAVRTAVQSDGRVLTAETVTGRAETYRLFLEGEST